MRTFETIRDVVDNAIEVHRQATDAYQRLRGRVGNDRVRMLLGYMIDHQNLMETRVRQYKDSAADAVLSTYIQYSLDEDPQQFLQSKIEEMDTLDIKDVEALAARVDDYLVNLFDAALQEMDSPKVMELLQDLLDLERLERRKLTMSISSLSDM